MTYEKGPEKSRDTMSSEGYLLLNSSLLFMIEFNGSVITGKF